MLRTVIDGYPIRGKFADYPPNSIRQIPGAFERRQFRAGGRMLTLDAIEKDVIGEFDDARALLALGARRHRRPAPEERSLHGGAARFAAADTMVSELVTSRDLVWVDIAERAAVGESAVLLA